MGSISEYFPWRRKGEAKAKAKLIEQKGRMINSIPAGDCAQWASSGAIVSMAASIMLFKYLVGSIFLAWPGYRLVVAERQHNKWISRHRRIWRENDGMARYWWWSNVNILIIQRPLLLLDIPTPNRIIGKSNDQILVQILNSPAASSAKKNQLALTSLYV